MKEVNAPNCGHESDLIDFLYGELNDDDSQMFRRHLNDCTGCRKELTTFQGVRESVVAWRNESLGGVVSPLLAAPSLLPALLPATTEKPSALAAFRQFFNLAPLWMKGSVAFASILFCLFAGLAIARSQLGSDGFKGTSRITVDNLSSAYTRQQIDALVEQRVQAEVQRIIQTKEKTSAAPVATGTLASPSSRRVASRREEVAVNAKARRPLSKTEREQLAADLRLISARNENELDLLDDGVNQ